MRTLSLLLLLLLSIRAQAQTDLVPEGLWKIESVNASGDYVLRKLTVGEQDREKTSDFVEFKYGKEFTLQQKCLFTEGLYATEGETLTLTTYRWRSPIECEMNYSAKAVYQVERTGAHMKWKLQKKETSDEAHAGLVKFILPADPMVHRAQYRKYAGLYGGNDGLALFEDGTFLLYGYATAIPGRYYFEGNLLHFYLNRPPTFEVFATHNPELGKKMRAEFTGFEDNETYLQLDLQPLRRVFNEDANCFDAPFVANFPELADHLTFYHRDFLADGDDPMLFKYRYENKAQYNDFMFIYNTSHPEAEDFTVVLNDDEKSGHTRLLYMSYGQGDALTRAQISSDDENWKELVNLKEEIARAADSPAVYANKHHKIFRTANEALYQYDQNKNQYVHKNAAANEAYFKSNPYADDRYLRKYERQPTVSMCTSTQTSVAKKPIFYTLCEDPENSYKFELTKVNNASSSKDRTVITEPLALSLPAAKVKKKE